MRGKCLRESLVVVLVRVERDDQAATITDQGQALGTVQFFLEPLTERWIISAGEERHLRSRLIAILPELGRYPVVLIAVDAVLFLCMLFERSIAMSKTSCSAQSTPETIGIPRVLIHVPRFTGRCYSWP